MPKRDRSGAVNRPQGLDTGAFVGVIALLVAALFFLLQANGVVEITWWFSVLVYLVLLAALIWAFYEWQVLTRWKPTKRHLVCSVGALVFFVLAAIGVRSEYGREHTAPGATSPVPTPVAIFADCQMTHLPISLPPQTTLHVLGLNQKFMASQDWGLYDIPNLTAKATQWPSKEVMEAERRKRRANKNYLNAGVFGYKCDVSNHGRVGVFDIAMPITFWLGEHPPKSGARYTVVVSPLDPGSRFTFYIFNDCPVSASGYLPRSVSVTVVGEPSRRTVPLYLPDRNPVQSFLLFFPSQVQWVRQQPCS